MVRQAHHKLVRQALKRETRSEPHHKMAFPLFPALSRFRLLLEVNVVVMFFICALSPLAAQDNTAPPTGVQIRPVDMKPTAGSAPKLSDSTDSMPQAGGALARIRAKYFYLGELTWRAGVLLGRETSEWGESRKQGIEDDIFRQASVSNNSRNQMVPASANTFVNYQVALEGLLGVNLDQVPGLRNVQWLKNNKFLRIGFHAYMAPMYKRQSQSISGPFSYYDPNALTPTRTYGGSVSVEENLLTVSPGMSFFYYYERGWGQRKWMPYLGIEVGFSIAYGKRKYSFLAEPASVVELSVPKSYSAEANLQESYVNAFGLRLMPAIGMQYHIVSGHYVDLRIGYQIQNYSVTLDRKGSFTETKTDAAGNFLLTYSEDFLNKTRETKLSQSGIVIMLGYTAGLF